ncbi:MAG: hypothetical protein K8T90_03875 [Planctomycetes bacterium]|nr:hypothetical protein [Planctomycetota bacterium]
MPIPAGEPHLRTTTVTSKTMDFEAHGWIRVACWIIGPPGLVVWAAWVATGVADFTWMTWVHVTLGTLGGVLFTLLAIFGKVRVPMGRTVTSTGTTTPH